MCIRDRHSTIYVREAYYEMFEIMLNGLEERRTKYRYLVLGSPGVGKSIFHAFCLYVLLQAGAPVYFVRRAHSALFLNGRVYKPLVPVHECLLLTDHNVWFLYDSLERPPTLTDSPIGMMVFSPRRIYNSYMKELSCPPMYMPLWEFEELEVANSILPEGHLPYEELVKRYDLCGGVPRQIFEEHKVYLKTYKNAFASVRHMDKLKKLDIHLFNHRIFGAVVGQDLESYQVCFLSNRIACEVNEFWKEDRAATVSRVVNASYDCVVGALYGKIYEVITIDSLRDLTKITCVSLDESMAKDKVVKLKPKIPMEMFNCQTLKEVELRNRQVLWKPRSLTFPCIDALLMLPESKTAVGLQFTLSEKHPIPKKSLREINDYCLKKWGYEFVLVFVVPRKNYDDFQKQKQTERVSRQNKEEDVDVPPRSEVPVKQFKLCID